MLPRVIKEQVWYIFHMFSLPVNSWQVGYREYHHNSIMDSLVLSLSYSGQHNQTGLNSYETWPVSVERTVASDCIVYILCDGFCFGVQLLWAEVYFSPRSLQCAKHTSGREFIVVWDAVLTCLTTFTVNPACIRVQYCVRWIQHRYLALSSHYPIPSHHQYSTMAAGKIASSRPINDI